MRSILSDLAIGEYDYHNNEFRFLRKVFGETEEVTAMSDWNFEGFQAVG
jgi:hypothetical protein